MRWVGMARTDDIRAEGGCLGKDKETYEPSVKELVGLAGYCSRLAGDNLCRCGGSLKGRLLSLDALSPSASN
jgi:hypothetical protein